MTELGQHNALTANIFQEHLHPRGRDGKFIEVGAIVKLLGLKGDNAGMNGENARVEDIGAGLGPFHEQLGKPRIGQPGGRLGGKPRVVVQVVDTRYGEDPPPPLGIRLEVDPENIETVKEPKARLPQTPDEMADQKRRARAASAADSTLGELYREWLQELAQMTHAPDMALVASIETEARDSHGVELVEIAVELRDNLVGTEHAETPLTGTAGLYRAWLREIMQPEPDSALVGSLETQARDLHNVELADIAEELHGLVGGPLRRLHRPRESRMALDPLIPEHGGRTHTSVPAFKMAKFSEALHPRGKDGKFIDKFGLVNVSGLHGFRHGQRGVRDVQGEVADIITDPHQYPNMDVDPRNPIIRVKITDPRWDASQFGETVDVRRQQISQRGTPKAKLGPLLPPLMPSTVQQNMPDTLLPMEKPPEWDSLDGDTQVDWVGARMTADMSAFRGEETHINFAGMNPEIAFNLGNTYRDLAREDPETAMRIDALVPDSQGIEYDQSYQLGPKALAVSFPGTRHPGGIGPMVMPAVIMLKADYFSDQTRWDTDKLNDDQRVKAGLQSWSVSSAHGDPTDTLRHEFAHQRQFRFLQTGMRDAGANWTGVSQPDGFGQVPDVSKFPETQDLRYQIQSLAPTEYGSKRSSEAYAEAWTAMHEGDASPELEQAVNRWETLMDIPATLPTQRFTPNQVKPYTSLTPEEKNAYWEANGQYLDAPDMRAQYPSAAAAYDAWKTGAPEPEITAPKQPLGVRLAEKAKDFGEWATENWELMDTATTFIPGLHLEPPPGMDAQQFKDWREQDPEWYLHDPRVQAQLGEWSADVGGGREHQVMPATETWDALAEQVPTGNKAHHFDSLEPIDRTADYPTTYVRGHHLKEGDVLLDEANVPIGRVDHQLGQSKRDMTPFMVEDLENGGVNVELLSDKKLFKVVAEEGGEPGKTPKLSKIEFPGQVPRAMEAPPAPGQRPSLLQRVEETVLGPEPGQIEPLVPRQTAADILPSEEVMPPNVEVGQRVHGLSDDGTRIGKSTGTVNKVWEDTPGHYRAEVSWDATRDLGPSQTPAERLVPEGTTVESLAAKTVPVIGGDATVGDQVSFQGSVGTIDRIVGDYVSIIYPGGGGATFLANTVTLVPRPETVGIGEPRAMEPPPPLSVALRNAQGRLTIGDRVKARNSDATGTIKDIQEPGAFQFGSEHTTVDWDTGATTRVRSELLTPAPAPGETFQGNQLIPANRPPRAFLDTPGKIDEYIAVNPRLLGESSFSWQSRLVDGMLPAEKHAVLWHARERYEPVDYVAAGATRWRTEHGLPEPTFDITEVPVPLARGNEVARAFEDTPDESGDPRVEAAYTDFKRQTAEMWGFMTSPEPDGMGVTVDFAAAGAGNPYPDAVSQAADLRENHHITIQSGLGGPHFASMTTEEYDQFRAVHDVFGHAGIGGGFDRHGEFQAYLDHSTMYTGDGRLAMASEYHGVNTALWGGGPGTPGAGKTILLPEELIPDPIAPDGSLDQTAVTGAGEPAAPQPLTALQLQLLGVDAATGQSLGYFVEQTEMDMSFPHDYDDNPMHPAVMAEGGTV